MALAKRGKKSPPVQPKGKMCLKMSAIVMVQSRKISKCLMELKLIFMNLRNKPEHSQGREPKNHAVQTCILLYLHLILLLKSCHYSSYGLFCPPESISWVMFQNWKKDKEFFLTLVFLLFSYSHMSHLRNYKLGQSNYSLILLDSLSLCLLVFI